MGIGLYHAIIIGIFIGDINRQILELDHTINNFLIIHRIRELPPIEKNKFRENRDKLLSTIKPKIISINSNIRGLNDILKAIKIEKRINKLKITTIKSILNERFNKIIEDESYQSIGNENFRMKMDSVFSDITKSVNDILLFVKNEQNIDKIEKIKNKEFRKDVHESNNIRSMGYQHTSILVVGRTIEKALDIILQKAIAKGKIKKMDLRKVKYKDKIGLIKNLEIINEKMYHDLNSIRIDRNETGHPIKIKNLKLQSKNILQKSVFILIELQRLF